jgi:hypothetical protein
MSEVYLIKPTKPKSLVLEEFYKKGKVKFSVITTWESPVLIVETLPKSKKQGNSCVTKLVDVEFKEGYSDKKMKLVLPDDFSIEEKKSVRKLFLDNCLWNLDDLGWKELKSTYTLNGLFDIKKVPVHKLELFTSLIEITKLKVSESEAINFSKNGVPESILDEIDNDVFDPIFDEITTLSVDDDEVKEFPIQFRTKYDELVKDLSNVNPDANSVKDNKLEFAFVREAWIKRAYYELTIYEEFDISKLDISVTREFVFGTNKHYDVFSLTYDGVDFEFADGDVANSWDFNLRVSNGKILKCNLIEDSDDYDDYDEYDEDEDEDQE